MKRIVAAALIALATVGIATAQTSKSTLFAQPWNAGVDRAEPKFQSQVIDKDTYTIRQSLRTSFEGPFLHLIFGTDKALLIDSGAEGANAQPEVDRLIAAWLAANGRTSVPLVVMHSHGHGDHIAGDAIFKARPQTTVVGTSPEDVAAFFGVKTWPTDVVTYDLGGRVIDIIPTPGHQPAHVMAFDRRTGILFSGDAVYPGKLYFQCTKAPEYLASLDRVAAFLRDKDFRWMLGAHIEMRTEPGKTFEQNDRARKDEHLLELPAARLAAIRAATAAMLAKPRVEPHDDFVLFPHPANPRGKQPPDWCDAA